MGARKVTAVVLLALAGLFALFAAVMLISSAGKCNRPGGCDFGQALSAGIGQMIGLFAVVLALIFAVVGTILMWSQPAVPPPAAGPPAAPPLEEVTGEPRS